MGLSRARAGALSVLLIDTYSLFFRAFYALPPMNTLDGEPTQALYGFSSLLLKLLREERPSGVAFALDRPEPTFRHQAYAGYKGTRDAVPSSLALQFRNLERLLDALRLPRFSVRGFEADDVLATLASELSSAGEHALIATGDRDMLQLVSPLVSVLFMGQRGKPAKLYDEAAVHERFGISPRVLPLYAALVGDSSDNIPKVKGVGPVAAQKLSLQFGDVQTLLAQVQQIDNARLRQIICDHAEQLRASEHLIRLRHDVPLPDGPHHAALTAEAGPDTRALFAELEFKSLLPRLDALLKT
ncbi:MAG: polymerase [Myxococcaceae bacterium]|nr:polymerase [Myxococcaceae bacterium]